MDNTIYTEKEILTASELLKRICYIIADDEADVKSISIKDKIIICNINSTYGDTIQVKIPLSVLNFKINSRIWYETFDDLNETIGIYKHRIVELNKELKKLNQYRYIYDKCKSYWASELQKIEDTQITLHNIEIELNLAQKQRDVIING